MKYWSRLAFTIACASDQFRVGSVVFCVRKTKRPNIYGGTCHRNFRKEKGLRLQMASSWLQSPVWRKPASSCHWQLWLLPAGIRGTPGKTPGKQPLRVTIPVAFAWSYDFHHVAKPHTTKAPRFRHAPGGSATDATPAKTIRQQYFAPTPPAGQCMLRQQPPEPPAFRLSPAIGTEITKPDQPTPEILMCQNQL